MNQVIRLPERQDVKIEDTWNLDSLFVDESSWEESFSQFEQQLEGYQQYQGKLADSAETTGTDVGLALEILPIDRFPAEGKQREHANYKAGLSPGDADDGDVHEHPRQKPPESSKPSAEAEPQKVADRPHFPALSFWLLCLTTSRNDVAGIVVSVFRDT